VTLFILLVRLGTPSAFVTNINAGSARPEPVVSARPCRIRQGLYSFLKRSSVSAFLAQQHRQLGDVGGDAPAPEQHLVRHCFGLIAAGDNVSSVTQHHQPVRMVHDRVPIKRARHVEAIVAIDNGDYPFAGYFDPIASR
jgi:hypothetical protein